MSIYRYKSVNTPIQIHSSINTNYPSKQRNTVKLDTHLKNLQNHREIPEYQKYVFIYLERELEKGERIIERGPATPSTHVQWPSRS